jgi:hypothetical protein
MTIFEGFMLFLSLVTIKNKGTCNLDSQGKFNGKGI